MAVKWTTILMGAFGRKSNASVSLRSDERPFGPLF
jgi:hypothetical protein